MESKQFFALAGFKNNKPAKNNLKNQGVFRWFYVVTSAKAEVQCGRLTIVDEPNKKSIDFSCRLHLSSRQPFLGDFFF
jgi:hypothetical protein